ncbi:hypothetical protein TNCV_3257361 [Trichonephila clavipes]|nr:hypothetical protein TNCV_3257361 [Trichonephila clavipes]
MEFKRLVTFHWISGISSNFFPFKLSMSRGKRKKSGGQGSGERTPFHALPFRFRFIPETPGLIHRDNTV